jgi:hypothetical protein
MSDEKVKATVRLSVFILDNPFEKIYIRYLMLALPNAPEAEPTGPCPWRPTQEIVELQSLNGGFTGNPSVILLKRPTMVP